jgi:hypothetical protein
MSTPKLNREAIVPSVNRGSYVRCVNNETYFKDDLADTFEPELIIGRIYKMLPASQCEQLDGFVRIIDGSGEDYLYPADYFVPIGAPSIEQPADQTVTVRLDEITKGILQAEALAAHKSMSALMRQWIDERLNLPAGVE